MELRPFKDMIALSEDKLKEEMAPIRARNIKSQAELEMSRLEANILKAETSVQEMCARPDICFTEVLNDLDDIDLMERRKRKCSDAIKQLFPEGK